MLLIEDLLSFESAFNETSLFAFLHLSELEILLLLNIACLLSLHLLVSFCFFGVIGIFLADVLFLQINGFAPAMPIGFRVFNCLRHFKFI